MDQLIDGPHCMCFCYNRKIGLPNPSYQVFLVNIAHKGKTYVTRSLTSFLTFPIIVTKRVSEQCLLHNCSTIDMIWYICQNTGVHNREKACMHNYCPKGNSNKLLQCSGLFLSKGM